MFMNQLHSRELNILEAFQTVSWCIRTFGIFDYNRQRDLYLGYNNLLDG